LLRQALAPIHPDGWRFIALFAVASVLLYWLAHPLGWLGLVATLWCVYFFRDPWRVTPLTPGLVIAPADGRIVTIDEAPAPPELGLGSAPMLRIAIFLNVLDVHVNRMPMAGRITKRVYRKGKFVNAGLDKASADNERMALRIDTPDGDGIAVVQIAGLVARRIVCTVDAGEAVIAGQRFGLIRFGSRAEIYVPPSWTPLAIVGQRAVGGETVIAEVGSGGRQRLGTEH
jgi:phosphatidylserine decarboxylase